MKIEDFRFCHLLFFDGLRKNPRFQPMKSGIFVTYLFSKKHLINILSPLSSEGFFCRRDLSGLVLDLNV